MVFVPSGDNQSDFCSEFCQKMFECLKFLILLLLIVLVNGKDLECDKVEFSETCWNSQTFCNDQSCWLCEIKDQTISSNDEVLTISGKLGNGSYVNVDFVQFSGGSIIKIPMMLQKTTNKNITQVELRETNTTVINKEFFRLSGKKL